MKSTPALLNPDLRVADVQVASWLTQVTLRLRREIAWLRRQRSGSAEDGSPATSDAAQDGLER